MRCLPGIFRKYKILSIGIIGIRLVLLALVTAIYCCDSALATEPPTVTADGSGFDSPRKITMTAPAGTIHYTLDGSNPDLTSPQFTNPFAVSSSCQIKAIASSGGIPSSITSLFLNLDPSLPTPIMWLKADAGVSTNTGNPPPVSSWHDLTESGNNASGGSSSTSSLLQNNSINRLPAVSFNGRYLSLPSGFANFSSGLTLFIVARSSTLTAGSRLIDFGTGSDSSNNIFVRISNSGSLAELGVYNGSTGTFAQSAGALVQNRYHLLEATLAPGSPNATATMYVDGVPGSANSSMNNIPNVTRTSNFLGQSSASNNQYPGNIAELILFPNLTTAQRQAAEAYLLQKYQLPVQDPPPPTISVPGGTLARPTQVVITSHPGTIVRFTTDGSTPSASTSPVYDGCPIMVNYSQTIKAIAIKNGLVSSVSTAAYTLDPTLWAAPSPSDMTAPTINLQLPTASQ